MSLIKSWLMAIAAVLFYIGIYMLVGQVNP